MCGDVVRGIKRVQTLTSFIMTPLLNTFYPVANKLLKKSAQWFMHDYTDSVLTYSEFIHPQFSSTIERLPAKGKPGKKSWSCDDHSSAVNLCIMNASGSVFLTKSSSFRKLLNSVAWPACKEMTVLPRYIQTVSDHSFGQEAENFRIVLHLTREKWNR